MNDETIAEDLAAARRALIDRRLRALSDAVPGTQVQAAAPAATGRDPERPVLSTAQRRMWFHEQLLPGGSAYNVSAAYRVRGSLDPRALDRALVTVLTRHESLRTRFAVADGEPFQVVERAPDRVLIREDAAGLKGTELEARCAAETAAPFDLAAGPLLRARLLRLADRDHVFLVTVHHSVFDGWSAGVFVNEVSRAYAAEVDHVDPDMPDLPLQYPDFAARQRSMAAGPEMRRQSAYWRAQLEAAPPLELPADRTRPPVATYRGERADFEVPPATVQGIRRLARAAGTTPFVVMLAGYQTLLGRYARADDFVVGTPVSGRNRTELEPMIGFFVNTLPLRARLDDDPSFEGLIHRVRETALDAYAHQEVPFEQIVEDLAPERDLSRNPLFQVWFGLLNTGRTGELGELSLSDCTVSELPTGDVTTRFDLELHIFDRGSDRLAGRFIGARDLFDEATVHRFGDHYLRLLAAAVDDATLPLSRIPLMSPHESRAALAAGHGPEEPVEDGLTFSELFERWAAGTPEALAIVCAEERLTYAQVNARANQLARLLRDRGVRPEVLVGLCVQRSPDTLVSLLAILKAGGGYLPLDPAAPRDRLRHIISEARVPLTVTRSGLAESLFAGEPVLLLDQDAEAIECRTTANLPSFATPDNLLYVVYTSGSTGRPKGVAMTHRPLLNMIGWQVRRSPVAGPTLQFSAINFDVSFQEVFSTWAQGAPVVMPSEDQRRDPDQLLDIMAEHDVRRLHCPPPVLELLAAAAAHRYGQPLPPLQEIVSAGEQLVLGPELRSLLDRLDAPAVDNQYGPTEAHAITALRMTGAPAEWPTHPPIGTPVGNVRVYLLDRDLAPVPPGLPGEIYVAGPCLARGYSGRPGLTAQVFLPDPYAEEPGSRMYRTGDLARRRAGGVLDYLGRIDSQVKIRGYRVEPEEVEACLADLPGVVRATVAVTDAPAGGRLLVGYVVLSPGSGLDPTGMVDRLRQRLPAYMVPAAVVILDEMPLSISGKVDRKRLPRPVLEGGGFVPPSDAAERAVAEIWQRALGCDRVGARDNFFELGGHSLAVPGVVHQVRARFGVDLPLRVMFDRPVLEDFAAAVRQADPGVAVRVRTATFRALTRPRESRAQMFCLPFAGGGPDAFDAFLPLLREHLDVHVAHLPGRGSRYAESMPRTAGALVPGVAAEMLPFLGETVVLFGHSMGALLAYELARELHRLGHPPACLVVSGQPSPQHRDPEGLHRLAPDEMLRTLAQFGGVDAAAFDEPELLELVLPTLRADVAFTETYAHTPGKPLDCPVIVYGSDGDPGTTPAALLGWRETTTGQVDTVFLRGGHFHLTADPEPFSADLLSRLATHLSDSLC
ncbi:non-ribosomal peptide synthetase [Streptomyces sp. NRRL F-5123]|uniref:non-ribosomal peptide synthetase n=1 Tax=Streptomyces sp. NRRL F-5123 TaxID=1463856 RepID=UPI000ACE2486|nr:non-ribosomal peptide synthetase [Streptomyces sp. NRRL F-5123]